MITQRAEDGTGPFCSSRHREAARSQRHAARARVDRLTSTGSLRPADPGPPTEPINIGGYFPYTDQPRPVTAWIIDRRTPAPLRRTGPARHRERRPVTPLGRRAMAGITLASLLAAGGGLLFGDRTAGPATTPAEPAAEPVSETDQRITRAEVALASIDRQLDVVVRTEADLNRIPALRPDQPQPAAVVALLHRKTQLAQERAVLRSQLRTLRSLADLAAETTAAQDRLDVAERALNGASSGLPGGDETIRLRLEAEVEMLKQQRGRNEALLRDLRDDAERALTSPLPEPVDLTTPVIREVRELIDTPRRDQRGTGSPAVVALGPQDAGSAGRHAAPSGGPGGAPAAGTAGSGDAVTPRTDAPADPAAPATGAPIDGTTGESGGSSSPTSGAPTTPPDPTDGDALDPTDGDVEDTAEPPAAESADGGSADDDSAAGSANGGSSGGRHRAPGPDRAETRAADSGGQGRHHKVDTDDEDSGDDDSGDDSTEDDSTDETAEDSAEDGADERSESDDADDAEAERADSDERDDDSKNREQAAADLGNAESADRGNENSVGVPDTEEIAQERADESTVDESPIAAAVRGHAAETIDSAPADDELGFGTGTVAAPDADNSDQAVRADRPGFATAPLVAPGVAAGPVDAEPGTSAAGRPDDAGSTGSTDPDEQAENDSAGGADGADDADDAADAPAETARPDLGDTVDGAAGQSRDADGAGRDGDADATDGADQDGDTDEADASDQADEADETDEADQDDAADQNDSDEADQSDTPDETDAADEATDQDQSETKPGDKAPADDA